MADDSPTLDDAEETIRSHDEWRTSPRPSTTAWPPVAPVFYHYEDGSLYLVMGGRS